MQQGLPVAQQAHGLVLVAVAGVVTREEGGEAFTVELLESVRQLGQQAFGEAAHGDVGRTALHGFGIGHRFGLHKIDADADHNRRLAVAAHGFRQDAAELFAADNQIVWPFNLRGHAQLTQHAAASQRSSEREAAQLGWRAGKTPACAEHQAFADAALPAAPLAASALGLIVHKRDAAVDRAAYFGLGDEVAVAGGVLVQ